MKGSEDKELYLKPTEKGEFVDITEEEWEDSVKPITQEDMVDAGATPLPFAPPAMNPSTETASVESAAPTATLPAQAVPTSSGSFATYLARANQPSGAKLTKEQEAILATAREIEVARGNDQRVLVIGAGAGTGKTFTLKQLEGALQGNGQYTAFNSSLVAESKTKFRKAACNTTHSLAFRAVGRLYAHRLNGRRVRSHEIANRLGIEDFVVELPKEISPPSEDGKPATRTLKASFLAGQVITAIRRFCQSDATVLGARFVQHIPGIDKEDSTSNSDRVRDYLFPFAQKLWADKCDTDGTMPFSHDDYVKIWQLGRDEDRPIIAADYILLDEAQDTAPVMLDILRQQQHALLILVGDDNQQIYEWRGAVNAMSAFKGAPRKLLSQSFRFGQAVADVANSVLTTLDEPTDLVMRGLPSIPSRVCPVQEPTCYLYRTNAGAISRLMVEQEAGRRCHLVFGSDGAKAELVSFFKGVLNLQAGRGTDHSELGCFNAWSEVQEYAKSDEGADLKLMVKLVDDFGAAKIINAFEMMPAEKDADVVASTAHRSKGREWSSVQLGPDFPTANKLTDADRRLLYVACTRAQEELDISRCPTFCGGWERKSDEEGPEWIPGIEVNYTAEVPSESALTAYRLAKDADTKPQPLVTDPKNAEMAPAHSKPVVVDTKSDMPNTWSRGKANDWVVRGKPGQSGVITVTRKNGTTSRETIKRVIWQNGEVALYEV